MLALLAAAAAAPQLAAASTAAADVELPALASGIEAVDTTVTHRLYLDIGLCPEAVRKYMPACSSPSRGLRCCPSPQADTLAAPPCPADTLPGATAVRPTGGCPPASLSPPPAAQVRTNRTLGDKTPFCTDPQPLGRIQVELFGRAAPGSVANIVAAAAAGAYDNTALSKVVAGRFIVAGAQGPKRSGLVQAPPDLPPNPDILASSAFRLTHRRPGTVSLNLSGEARRRTRLCRKPRCAVAAARRCGAHTRTQASMNRLRLYPAASPCCMPHACMPRAGMAPPRA